MRQLQPAASVPERLAKTLVLTSAVLALCAHVALTTREHEWLWWVTAVAFGSSVALAWASLRLSLVAPLVLAYTAPAALMLLADTTDYSLIVIWLALLVGPVVVGSDWQRWRTPARWTIALAAWALILALSWPVIALREIDFSLIAARTLNTPNGVLAPPPPFSAALVILAALGQLVGLLWLDMLWARFGGARARDAERWVFAPLMVSIMLACGVALWQKSVDITWLSVEPWPRLQRAAGTMLDANSFGTAAAVWAPLGLALAWRRGWPTMLGLGVTTLALGGMWTTASRTAFLVAAIGVVGIAAALVQFSRRARAAQAGSPVSRYAIAFLVMAAGAGIVVTLSVRGETQASPLARLIETIPSESEGGLRAVGRDLWERDGYGTAVVRAVTDHPWTGLGVGAFPLLAPDYFRLETGGFIPSDNAQNWWRHQVAELGVIGALPAMIVSMGIFLMLVVGKAAGEARAAVMLLRGAIAGVGLASLVGMGTQHPALFLTFVTMVFWTGALLDAPAPGDRPGGAWWGVILLAIVVAAGQAYSAVNDLRVPHRAERHGFTYGYGFSDPEQDPKLGEVRRAATHAVGVIPAEHAYFHVVLIAPHATTDEPVRVKLWRRGELIVDQRVSGPEPIERYLAVAPGTRQLMVELDVSRAAEDGTALQVASQWLRELPEGTNPGLVVRY